MGRFGGKVVLVTGGSSGIGRATILAFAREGAKVVIANRGVEGGEETLRMVKEVGGEGIFVKMDVTDDEQVKAGVAQALDIHGRIDILVNNAGWDKMADFAITTPEDWDTELNLNLRGPIMMCHTVIQNMLAQKSGTIVNVSSIAGRSGSEFQVPYASAKAGVIVLTKSLARAYASRGIRVNCVCPGPILTPLLEDQMALIPDLREGILQMTPLGRIGTSEEAAAVVLFMASDEASYITGQTLNVDGGISMD